MKKWKKTKFIFTTYFKILSLSNEGLKRYPNHLEARNMRINKNKYTNTLLEQNTCSLTNI